MELFACSTGLVELVVLSVKPGYDLTTSILLPHRFKNLGIATGASLKVLRVALLVFERYTIENVGFGNGVSISLQLVVDIGNSNLCVSTIADTLAAQPHHQNTNACLMMINAAGSCFRLQVGLRVVW